MSLLRRAYNARARAIAALERANAEVTRLEAICRNPADAKLYGDGSGSKLVRSVPAASVGDNLRRRVWRTS